MYTQVVEHDFFKSVSQIPTERKVIKILAVEYTSITGQPKSRITTAI
jgi:hypothetical protein